MSFPFVYILGKKHGSGGNNFWAKLLFAYYSFCSFLCFFLSVLFLFLRNVIPPQPNFSCIIYYYYYYLSTIADDRDRDPIRMLSCPFFFITVTVTTAAGLLCIE